MEENNNIENVEIAENKKPKRKLIIIGIIVFICIIAGLILFLQSRKVLYIEKLETTRLEMLDSGSDAESICNLTSKVWYNAIYEEFDDETDKYTRTHYGIADSFINFNEAIGNLYSDEDIIDKVSSIQDNQKNVKALIKDLQNPPKDLKDCYDTILNMYDYYKNLTDLAINPTGSLEDYSNSKNDAVDGFMTEYEKLDNIMP